MATYLPLDMVENDFTAGKSGTVTGSFTAASGKSYIFVYMKDGSADTGNDNATIGYNPSTVSASINSSAGATTGWTHSTTSFNGNPNGLTHESDTTYNWGLTSDFGSTDISLSGLRTKYIESALIGAADNSGLQSGTANTKFSDFRGTKLLFDGSDVPTGSTAAISIGTVFRNKRFAVSSKVGHVNTDSGSTGKHSTYSYLKLTFSSDSLINWSVSSETGYDFLYIYVEEDVISTFAFNFFLMDSYGDGWNGAEVYIQNSSNTYLPITAAGAPNGSDSAGGGALGTNGITLPSGSGSSSTSAGNISLPAADYTITVTAGAYASEITWTVKDVDAAAVSFTTGGTTPVNGTFYLRVDSAGGGSEVP